MCSPNETQSCPRRPCPGKDKRRGQYATGVTTARIRPDPTRHSFRAARTTGPERWFVTIVVFSQVYYFHRWLYQYSDSGTSPTYSNTPLAWQIAKYPVILILTAFCLVNLVALRTRFERNYTYGFSTTLSLTFLGATLLTLSSLTDNTLGLALYRIWFFIPAVLMLPLIYRGRPTLDVLHRCTKFLVAYHIVFTGIEYVAYQVSGRLPGLSYPGGLVRFGGGLDDPNGFAILLVLPILVLLASPSKQKVLAIGTLTVLLLMTVSFSGTVAAVVGLFTYIYIARRTKVLLASFSLMAVGALYGVHTGLFAKIYSEKAISAGSRFSLGGSAATGGDGIGSFLSHASIEQLVFGAAGRGYVSENAYFFLVMNYGLLLTVAVSFLCVATIVRGLRRVRALRAQGQIWAANYWAALTSFILGFAVASLGVPYLSVFPVNLVFWTVSMLVWLPNSTPSVTQFRAG